MRSRRNTLLLSLDFPSAKSFGRLVISHMTSILPILIAPLPVRFVSKLGNRLGVTTMLYSFSGNNDNPKTTRPSTPHPFRFGLTGQTILHNKTVLRYLFSSSSLSKIVVTTLLALILTATTVAAAAVSAQQETLQASRKKVEKLTLTLTRLMNSYHHANKAEKVQLQKELINKTKNRQLLLAELGQTDPAGALRTVLPDSIRLHMPAEVQQLLEQKAVLQGQLELSHEDYADGMHKLRHVLTTEGGCFELNLPEGAKGYGSMQSGMQVRARGWLLAHDGATRGSLLINESPEVLEDTSWGSGDIYTNQGTALSFSNKWVDDSGDAANISSLKQGCTQANPSLTITPAESAWVEAGSNVSYTVTVTNNDSRDCAASDFDVAAELPAGWSADKASLNLEPGSSDTVTITITSPTAATEGFYDIPITATNIKHQGIDTVTYVVDLPAPTCATVNPLLSISTPDGEPVAAGTDVTYSVTVTNQDKSNCDPAIFRISAAVPEGWSSSSEEVSLAAGKTTDVEISVLSAANTASGTYQVPISVENLQDNNFFANATVTYTVAPIIVCEPANPQLELSVGSGEEVAAGAAVQYTGTLTNQNSPGCAASDFKVSATVPTGWSATSQGINLAPGASAPITLNVTSAASAEEGTYSISITAENAADASYFTSAPANFPITAPVNNTPLAVDDSVSLPAKGAATIEVLANDSGREGGKLEIVQVTQGSQGSVQINSDGSLLYTPVKNFKDSDSFIYTVSDGESTATATVTVTPSKGNNGK